MLEGLFSPATTPFAVALVLMLIIAAVELSGTLIGLSPSAAFESLLPELDSDLDADFAGGPMDADAPASPNAPSAGPLSQVLGWLCVGKVPILILLIVFLTVFGIAGLIIQIAFGALLGFAPPAFVSAIPAIAIATPSTRIAGLTLSKIMPKEQTEAVSATQFIGKIAVIVRGEAIKGEPAEAKLADSFGQTHYVLIEPDEDGEKFIQGDEALIVWQSGSVFHAIRNLSAAMTKESLD
jgi:hypothetical protein